MLLVRSNACTSVHRAHTFHLPPSQGLIWISRHLLTVREVMEASPPLYPKLECWGKSSPQDNSPITRFTPQPHQHTSQQVRNASSTHFCCKSIGASVEGRPFTRDELATRHVAHHFFTSMPLQQQEVLLTLDQKVKAHPPSSMNLWEESFPWKLEEFSRTTIATQFYKLVELYWTLRSFMAQGMKQRDDISYNLNVVLKDNKK